MSLRRPNRAAAVLVAACASLALAASAQAAPGDVVLVSPPNKTGATENGTDVVPATSGSGAFVAYLHQAPFGEPIGLNPGAGLFLRTMATFGPATAVDVPTGEIGGNGFEAGSPSLDGSGRHLAFVSEDPDVSSEDVDYTHSVAVGKSVNRDVFVYDRTTKKIELVSRGNGRHGVAAGDDSNLPQISEDGRFVAFGTEADNLIPRSVFGRTIYGGVFVRDLRRGTTTLASRADGRNGKPLLGYDPSISMGGTRVAFTYLAGRRGHRHQAIYIRDMRRGRTTLVSHAGSRDCVEASLAASGRFVAYTCRAANRNEGTDQIYVTDLSRGKTVLASRAEGPKGAPGGGDSLFPSISADGSLVAFESYANDLGPKDGTRYTDAFVKDLKSGRVYLASRADGDGPAGNGPSESPSISADGRFVSFASHASNLVPQDSDHVSSVFRYQILP